MSRLKSEPRVQLRTATVDVRVMYFHITLLYSSNCPEWSVMFRSSYQNAVCVSSFAKRCKINYRGRLFVPYINKIQRDATICRCLFTAKLLYTFRVPIAPINRSTSNCNCSFWYRSLCQSNNLPPPWPNQAILKDTCKIKHFCNLKYLYKNCYRKLE